MPARIALLIAFVVCILSIPVRAQDDTPELSDGWTFERQCLAEPTPAPEDWAFDGTILMTGPYGIQGLRSDWATTRVLAFTNVAKPGNKVSVGIGTLSPNMQWFAAPERNTFCTGSCVGYFSQVEGLHVFDITGNNPRQSLSMPWSIFYTARPSGDNEIYPRWSDNETLIYPIEYTPNHNLPVPVAGFTSLDMQDHNVSIFNANAQLAVWAINPFTKETSLWNGHRADFQLASPDGSRYFQDFLPDSLKYDYHLIDTKTGTSLQEMPPNFAAWSALWSPASTQFIAAIYDEASHTSWINRYDQNGHMLGNIIRLDSGDMNYGLYRNTIMAAWSPNNRYVILYWGRNRNQYYSLDDHSWLLLDLEQKRAVDTCLESPSLIVWSSDNQQLAFVDYNSDYSINIIDRDLTYWYTVGSIQGYTIGWRAD